MVYRIIRALIEATPAFAATTPHTLRYPAKSVSGGVGSSPYMAGEPLSARLGIKMTHVPRPTNSGPDCSARSRATARS